MALAHYIARTKIARINYKLTQTCAFAIEIGEVESFRVGLDIDS
jgi:hypothetical protein